MRKRISIISIVLSVILLSGCEDFLDTPPVGMVIPKTTKDYDGLLNSPALLSGLYADYSGNSYYAFLGDNISISKNKADYQYMQGSTELSEYAAYTFKTPYENPLLPHTIWSDGIYIPAEIYNTVIEGVAKLDNSKNDLYSKQVIAQAKAMRAWGYMIGGLGYGPMFDPNGENTVKTIPYRLSSEPSVENPSLSSTKELFELVIKDLNEAVEDAPEFVAHPSRLNKAAILAIRAEYYMYTRNWEMMLKDATEAWDIALNQKQGIENIIYNYNSFSYNTDNAVTPPDGSDPKIALPLEGHDGEIMTVKNKENMFFRSAPAYSYMTYPSDDYINIFDKEKDTRFYLFFLKSMGFSFSTEKGNNSDGLVYLNYRSVRMIANHGMTYPQLLLMKAEANARLGNLSEALTNLNMLRKYRYSGESSDLAKGSTLSQDELINEILDERRRELPMISYQRVFDLRRYMHDSGKPWSKEEVINKIGDTEYKAKLNSDKFYLRISNVILTFNPKWGISHDERPFSPK